MSAASMNLNNALAARAYGRPDAGAFSGDGGRSATASSESSFDARLTAVMRNTMSSPSSAGEIAASSHNLRGTTSFSGLARASAVPGGSAHAPTTVTPKRTQADTPGSGSQTMQPASPEPVRTTRGAKAGASAQADAADASSTFGDDAGNPSVPAAAVAHAGSTDRRPAAGRAVKGEADDPASGSVQPATIPPGLVPAAPIAAAASAPGPAGQPVFDSAAIDGASDTPAGGPDMSANSASDDSLSGALPEAGATSPTNASLDLPGHTLPNPSSSPVPTDPGASAAGAAAGASSVAAAATSPASDQANRSLTGNRLAAMTQAAPQPSVTVTVSTPRPGSRVSAANWSTLASHQDGSAGAADAATPDPTAATLVPPPDAAASRGDPVLADAAKTQASDAVQADIAAAGSTAPPSTPNASPLLADHTNAHAPQDDASATTATPAAPAASTPTTATDGSSVPPAQASLQTGGGVQALSAGPPPASDPTPAPATGTGQPFDVPTFARLDQADIAGAPAQVGASLLTLAASADGSSRMAISLHPKELGAVQVQLERSADGTIRIMVAASEPGTLRSLMTNQNQLHAALDDAAVPTANRHLSFELAAPAPATSSHIAHPDASASSRLDFQTTADLSGFRNSERQEASRSQDDRAGGFGGRGRHRSNDMAAAGADPVSSSSPSSTRRAPSGRVNITA